MKAPRNDGFDETDSAVVDLEIRRQRDISHSVGSRGASDSCDHPERFIYELIGHREDSHQAVELVVVSAVESTG